MTEIPTEPLKLQQLIESGTAGYAIHKSRRENPYPNLRTSDGKRREVTVTKTGEKRAAIKTGRRDVRPAWVYMIHCKTNTEKRNSKRIADSSLDLVVMMPRQGKRLLYPGLIFVGFDHRMKDTEYHALVNLHAGVVDQESLPREAAERIRVLASGKEAV